MTPFICKARISRTAGSVEARGNTPIQYSFVECSAQASHIDFDWFFNDFFFFLAIVLADLFSALGVPATCETPHELPDKLNARSVNSAALCLAYAAALGGSYKPYGVPTSSFTGSLPVSYWIYTMGLVVLACSTLYSAFAGFYAIGATRDREKFARASDMFKLHESFKIASAINSIPSSISAAAGLPPTPEQQEEVAPANSSGTINRPPASGKKKKEEGTAEDYMAWFASFDLYFLVSTHVGVIIASIIMLVGAAATYQNHLEGELPV